jgi:hypothetical protein
MQDGQGIPQGLSFHVSGQGFFLTFCMLDARQKRIAVVGNADVTKDYSSFIDSCEIVIRLNLRSGLPALMHGRLGKKTDILAYAPRATRLVLDDREHAGQLRRFAEGAQRIWFLGPRLWFRLRPGGIIRFLVRNKRLAFDASATMLKVLQLDDRRIEYFPRGFRHSVAKKLQALDGNTGKAFPSAGIVVIQRVLEDPEFEPYQKYVLGFTFEGWQGHPLAVEKRLVEAHSANGLLQILPVD